MGNEFLDSAALYHAILFSYELGISHTAHLDKRLTSTRLMYPFLDEMSKVLPFGKAVEGDPNRTLREFADRIVDLQLAGRVEAEPTSDGCYSFTIHNCIFAGDLHKRFIVTDVVCPLALYARLLAERSSGLVVKENPSVFSDNGSQTLIEFTETKARTPLSEKPPRDITRWIEPIVKSRERRVKATTEST